MSSINFDNPYLLLIAIPLVAAFVVPFALAVRKSNLNGHNLTSLILHILLSLTIAFTAAGTNITTVLSETDVYVVVDVSYSANKNLDTIDSYIKNLDLPLNSKLAVVAFGKDQQLLYELGDPNGFGTVRDATVDDSQTNIAEALEYAGSLFKENVIKRIVLITDGKQTDSKDTYAVKRAISDLELKNVRVDAIYLDDNISDEASEVQLSSVRFTKNTYLDMEEAAVVNVQSSYETQAFLKLYSNDTELKSRPVLLYKGANSFNLSLDTSKAGTFEYEVRIEAEGDENPFNNKYTFTQSVEGNIRMLFVTDSWEDCQKAVERYGSNEIDIYENDLSVKVLDKDKYISTLPNNIHIHKENLEVPFTVEGLCKFDEVVLADVDLANIRNATLFVESLDTVVSQFGKSLLTFGDLGVQNKDNEDVSRLDDILPVRFRTDNAAPKLYTIVLDTSRSMEYGSGMRLFNAKLIAKELIGILNPGDNVCVVNFAGDVRIAQSPKPIGDGKETKELIDNLKSTQGTVIGKGLQAAYDMIRGLQYADKQVMLITDGLTYSNEADNPAKIASEMYADGIVTSVIDMARYEEGANGATTDANSIRARQLLRNIAENGKGNYYYYSNDLQLSGEVPDVLFGQLTDNVTDARVDGRQTNVNVARRVDEVLEGIDRTAIPSVWGYMYSYNKASATTVLTVSHLRNGRITEQPLYAYWSYGIGQVSSFTSEFTGDWLREWTGSDCERFFANVIKQNIPEQKTDHPFNLEVIDEGSYARVEVTPSEIRLSAVAVAEITLPDGSVTRSNMTLMTDRYVVEFPLASTGKYSVNVIYTYNLSAYTARNYLDIAYLEEYDSFATYDANGLHNAIDENGTLSMDGKLSIENDERELGTYTNRLTVPLLIVSVALFIVDIIIRKLKWEDIVSFFGIKKKGGKK